MATAQLLPPVTSLLTYKLETPSTDQVHVRAKYKLSSSLAWNTLHIVNTEQRMCRHKNSHIRTQLAQTDELRLVIKPPQVRRHTD